MTEQKYVKEKAHEGLQEKYEKLQKKFKSLKKTHGKTQENASHANKGIKTLQSKVEELQIANVHFLEEIKDLKEKLTVKDDQSEVIKLEAKVTELELKLEIRDIKMANALLIALQGQTSEIKSLAGDELWGLIQNWIPGVILHGTHDFSSLIKENEEFLDKLRLEIVNH